MAKLLLPKQFNLTKQKINTGMRLIGIHSKITGGPAHNDYDIIMWKSPVVLSHDTLEPIHQTGGAGLGAEMSFGFTNVPNQGLQHLGQRTDTILRCK